MDMLSRRQFLMAATGMPLAFSPTISTLAQTSPLVRYDIASSNGAAMLDIYAWALRSMLSRSQSDPLGWRWQWYTHFVNGATTKSAELTRIFGSGTSSRRTLAEEVWNTCQSHSGQNPNYFLPWHRMYTYYLERIVRRISGVADFAMPYWDYTSSDPTKRGVVPAQFRMPADPRYGVLYRRNRNALANSGEPIDLEQPGDAMDIDVAINKASYSTIGSVQGFCRAIDSGIHGRIHVLVGNSTGMGSVPYAGNDPLFAVHHANIDRMWASWIRNGHSNPTDATISPWITHAFALVDSNSERVTQRCRDLFSITQLGYAYSRYLSASTTENITLAAATTAPSKPNPVRVAAATSPVHMGAEAVTATLLRIPATRNITIPGLEGGSGQAILVLAKLHAWKQPGVLYHVYVSDHPSASRDGAHYAGVINFFDAEFHTHGADSILDQALGDNFYSFDITEILKLLANDSHGRQQTDALFVTFVPGGMPAFGANPIVAKLDLIANA